MSPTVSAQSVDGLLDHFNLRILNVMEAVAPIRLDKIELFNSCRHLNLTRNRIGLGYLRSN